MISAARRERGMTGAELAERVGITRVTLRRIERGEPGVAIGTVFEAANLVGVPLFGQDAAGLRHLRGQVESRVALLPAHVRRTKQVDDDF